MSDETPKTIDQPSPRDAAGFRIILTLLKLSVVGLLLVVGYLVFAPDLISYMVVAGIVYVFASAVWLSVVAWAYFKGQFEAVESSKMVLFEREELE